MVTVTSSHTASLEAPLEKGAKYGQRVCGVWSCYSVVPSARWACHSVASSGTPFP